MNLFKKAKISGSKEGYLDLKKDLECVDFVVKNIKAIREILIEVGVYVVANLVHHHKLKMKNLSGSEKIMEERDKKLDQLGI
jgi:hypothetical protein